MTTLNGFDLVIFWLASLFLIGYAWMVTIWIRRWKRISAPSDSLLEANGSGELTVIIPCRNEASCLPQLIDDLQHQTLTVQIIVIDDSSEDETAQIAKTLGIKTLSGSESGKKSAIKTGIASAQTKWVATVDADVRLGIYWAQSMLLAAIEKNATAVIGSVAFGSHYSHWDRFQALEYGAMMVWIGGGVHHKELAMGSGANLLFKRADYPLNDLLLSVASGDDTFALEAIQKQAGKLVWQGDERARVITSGLSSWPELWKQRARWASKAPHFNNLESFGTALFIGAVQCALIACPFAALFAGSKPLIFAAISMFILKCIIDYPLLRIVSSAFKIPSTPLDFIEFAPRYLILVFGAWVTMLRQNMVWKGRRI